MPSTSEKQAAAMRIAAAGKSNIGIPKKVGAEFVAADKAADKAESPFPEYMDAQQGHRRKAHRGRRSHGKGPKPVDHHAEAKKHIEKAGLEGSPHKAHAHLFRAVTAMNKARKATPE